MSEILKLVTDAINENDKQLSFIYGQKDELVNKICEVQTEINTRLVKRDKLQRELKEYYDKLQQWPVHFNEKCGPVAESMTTDQMAKHKANISSAIKASHGSQNY